MARSGISFPIRAHYRRTKVGLDQVITKTETITNTDTVLKTPTRTLAETITNTDSFSGNKGYIIVQYSFTGSSAAPTTTIGNITAGNATNGSLTSLTFGTGGSYSTPVAFANPPNGTSTAALAITNNSYFFFTITPNANVAVSLSSLTFLMARGGASTPRGYDIRSSVDSYAATLGQADIPTQRTTMTAVTIDLKGASFQNITAATTFRIYVYGPNGTSLDADDVTLVGLRSFTPTYTETITNTDSIIRVLTRALVEAITNSDTITRVWAHTQTILESLTNTDSIVRAITHVLTETITNTDTLIKRLNGFLFNWSTIPKSSDPSWSAVAKAVDPTWTPTSKSSNPTWTPVNKSTD